MKWLSCLVATLFRQDSRQNPRAEVVFDAVTIYEARLMVLDLKLLFADFLSAPSTSIVGSGVLHAVNYQKADDFILHSA